MTIAPAGQTAMTVTEAPAAGDLAALDRALDGFNKAATGIDDRRPLAILLKRDDGTLRAGLSGHSWGGCCSIKLLWVADGERGSGLGRRLMAAAEAEAARRGCRQILLSTHSFQAPGFYEKLGYHCLARIPDDPRGHARLVLAKQLAPEADRPPH